MTECLAAASVPTSAGAGSLTCHIENALEALESLREEWDEFVQAAHGDIYFTYDWCRIYWRHYAHGRDLRIFLFHAGSQLAGIVPMVIERLWLGPLPIRLARLLGSDWTPAVLHPPVLPDHAVSIYRKVVAYSLRELRCNAVSFARLSGEFITSEAIRHACEEIAADACVVRDRAIARHTVFHLPASFDDYLGDLSKSERGNYRRDERRLAECGSITVCHAEAPDEIQAAFESFAALHAAQWRREGMLGHFGDWPKSLAFTRELLRAISPCGRAKISALAINGTIVAMEFDLRLGETLYWRLPARNSNPEWDKHGLGRVALVRQIESAIASGIKRIEAGSGHYPYKLRLGGVEYPLHSILVARNRWWPRLKTRLLAVYADLLNLLYYRIWFCRVAPRLPLPRRPLWKSWIRTRV